MFIVLGIVETVLKRNNKVLDHIDVICEGGKGGENKHINKYLNTQINLKRLINFNKKINRLT